MTDAQETGSRVGQQAAQNANGVKIDDNVTCEYHDKYDLQVGYDETHNYVLKDHGGVDGVDPSVDHVHVYSNTTVQYGNTPSQQNAGWKGDAVNSGSC